MNKRALKIISDISKKLPSTLYNSIYKVKCSGSDALLSGQTKIDGLPINPKGSYVMNNTLQREIDHKSRMKRIYKKRGKIGLMTYLKPYCIPEKFGAVQVFIMNNIP